MRMKPEHFDHLLLVKEDLTKKDYCSIKFSVYCILPMQFFITEKYLKIMKILSSLQNPNFWVKTDIWQFFLLTD